MTIITPHLVIPLLFFAGAEGGCVWQRTNPLICVQADVFALHLVIPLLFFAGAEGGCVWQVTNIFLPFIDEHPID